ncbi:hypothetical protein [Streptomyces sp. NPDC048350]|uniref:hypothetical protein n=1 Tax=Streptomyces sp. NPDC048350 TaxID=3365538 RepID=UPI0037168BB7
MWNETDFTAKAKLYFGRAEDSYDADDKDQGYLWLLLGFEFLLRAPLARISPVLLASHEGNSTLSAAGIDIGSETPRNINTSVVARRLAFVVDGFRVEQVQKDISFIANIRNEELHSGSSPLRNIPAHKWLPKFLQVVEAIASHLGEATADYLPQQVITEARHLQNVEDGAVRAEVSKLIARHKGFFGNLLEEEVNNRKKEFPLWVKTAECPACNIPGKLTFSTVQKSRERIEDDAIIYEERQIATGFECTVCGITLESAARMHAANLYQEIEETYAEDLSERYSEPEDPGYYMEYDDE